MNFTPADISEIEGEYARVHAVTAHVLEAQLSPETLPTIDAHQTDLDCVIGSLESLETYYDGIVRKYQNLRDAVKDKRKVLERDHDAAKRKYWATRKEADRTRTS